MLNVVTLNYYVNEENVVNTRIDGDETLLDADILICSPSGIAAVWDRLVTTYSSGNQVIKLPESAMLRNTFQARRNEIENILDNGKVVIVFLEPVEGVKGEKNSAGSRRNEYKTITNYDFLPLAQEYLLRKLKSGTGKSENAISINKSGSLFTPYYHAFKQEITYTAYFDIDGSEDENFFLLNRSNKPVGAILPSSDGLIVFIPTIEYQENHEKFLGVIISEAKKYISKHVITPPPSWIEDFELKGENELNQAVTQIQKQIDELETKKKDQLEKAYNLEKYKALLFEQGPELEKIVIDTFKLFGFEAENRQVDDLEHDVIFNSEEGHGIAEIEGKDNDAIHISKLDQLNRAVDESFDLTGEYPQGLLIGNHFRFTKPENRKEPFTEKVLIVAQKKSFGLITTCELFKAVQLIFENPNNEALKKEIRERILSVTGEVISLTE